MIFFSATNAANCSPLSLFFSEPLKKELPWLKKKSTEVTSVSSASVYPGYAVGVGILVALVKVIVLFIPSATLLDSVSKLLPVATTLAVPTTDNFPGDPPNTELFKVQIMF